MGVGFLPNASKGGTTVVSAHEAGLLAIRELQSGALLTSSRAVSETSTVLSLLENDRCVMRGGEEKRRSQARRWIRSEAMKKTHLRL